MAEKKLDSLKLNLWREVADLEDIPQPRAPYNAFEAASF